MQKKKLKHLRCLFILGKIFQTVFCFQEKWRLLPAFLKVSATYSFHGVNTSSPF